MEFGNNHPLYPKYSLRIPFKGTSEEKFTLEKLKLMVTPYIISFSLLSSSYTFYLVFFVDHLLLNLPIC